MKSRISIHIALALLILAPYNSSAQSPASSSLPEIPMVDYCELIQNPSRYDQKIIRVRAIYVRGSSQNSKFYDFECDYHGSTWVEFDPSYKSCSKSKQINKLARLIRKSEPYSKPHSSVVVIPFQRAEVTFVGKFEANLLARVGEEVELPDPNALANNILAMVKTDYAHYFHYQHLFAVSCVEQVKAISPKAPW